MRNGFENVFKSNLILVKQSVQTFLNSLNDINQIKIHDDNQPWGLLRFDIQTHSPETCPLA